MTFAEIDDPRGLCSDVTGLGRWGNSDVESSLQSLEELPYAMGLVRQSFERQMGDRVFCPPNPAAAPGQYAAAQEEAVPNCSGGRWVGRRRCDDVTCTPNRRQRFCPDHPRGTEQCAAVEGKGGGTSVRSQMSHSSSVRNRP
jgi:hypothetical protein